MATAILSRRIKSAPPIAWNDLEALPIYACVAMALAVFVVGLVDLQPTLHAQSLKAIVLVGCLALRHAWLRMDDKPSEV